MNLITRDFVIRQVPMLWRKQYYHRTTGNWDTMYNSRNSGDVYQVILPLAEKLDRAGIDAAIGNSSWTSNKCSECGRDVSTAIELGDGYGEYTPERFCRDCVVKALALLDSRELPETDGEQWINS